MSRIEQAPAPRPGRVRTVIVTNIPAPYRLPVYELLSREPDIELHLIFCSGREPDRQWDVGQIGVRHVFLRQRYLTWRGRYIHVNPDVWEVLSAIRPDIVVTTGFNPTHLIGWMYCRVRGAAHLASTDGTLESERTLGPLHRLVRRIVYRTTAAFVAASSGGVDLYRSYGVDDGSIFRSPLCADNAAFLAAPDTPDAHDLLFCGRFVPVKNPLFALQVAAGAARRLGRRVSIAFVGAGPMEDQMRAAAATLGDVVDAVFPGFAGQGELPGRYKSARVFLFPTHWDPWGVVANEACAAGLPVLISPFAGAANDLIRDGENGYVLPLDEATWSRAAARLLSESALRRQMGRRAREAVASYSYQNAAAALALALRKALPRDRSDAAPGVSVPTWPFDADSRAGAAPLRVLVVHNAYRLSGGEDAVVEAEADLLRSNGQIVQTYLRHNHELASMSSGQAAAQAMWSARSAREIAALADQFHPDVVHFHNTFPLVSPSSYWAARRAGAAVTQTLHNFRLLCPQAMLLREGKVCERCVGRFPMPGVLHGCYRGSRLQTGVVATMLGIHRAAGTYRRAVDRYIALNEFCRKKFVQAGWPEEQVLIKPNFVADPKPGPGQVRCGGLFVGRLAPEKGLKVLADAAASLPPGTITVMGGGPLEELVATRFGKSYVGNRAPHEVMRAMQSARYLVLPSLWYESFPRTLVEAFACGLPVIASRIGALAELVSDGHDGLLFAPADPVDLATKLQWAERHPQRMAEMGCHARSTYERLYSPGRNFRRLMEIYRDAMAARASGGTFRRPGGSDAIRIRT